MGHARTAVAVSEKTVKQGSGMDPVSFRIRAARLKAEQLHPATCEFQKVPVRALADRSRPGGQGVGQELLLSGTLLMAGKFPRLQPNGAQPVGKVVAEPDGRRAGDDGARVGNIHVERPDYNRGDECEQQWNAPALPA